jgi:Holliday junction resolvase-like predicted endonuclease
LNIETEAIISLLKLSREGPVSHEALKRDAKMPSPTIRRLLQKLQNDGLINLQKNTVEADALNRLKLAVRAVQSGADLERVSRLLQWQEFEAIAAYGFEHNGYRVFRNVHFKHGERRYEIDIAACQGQLMVCADCKHWKRSLAPSVLNKVVEEQVQRTFALAEALPNPKIKISFSLKGSMTFVAAILTLVPARLKFCDDVPVVSVLQSQDFLNELPGHVHALKHFQKKMTRFKTLA